MHATVGDRIVVRGQRVGEATREADVLEVHGDDGAPPFVVRWRDDGHVATYFPGADATVQHDAVPAPMAAVESDDPVRRDVLESLATMRADVARLRAAVGRVVGIGGEVRSQAAAALAKRVAQVDCEVSALIAEVRAGQADTGVAVRTALEDAVLSVRTVIDELRVQAHLAGNEADDAWQQAVDALGRLRDNPAMPMDAARAVAADVVARLRSVVT
jgi:Domain of unknown function (DUF1918)